MLKKIQAVFVFLFVFSGSTTLMGNETAKTYFPGTFGSYWVYQDQDGNELTRTVDEGEEIAGEVYNIFIYEPEIEDWADCAYHFLPSLYSVNDESITCLIGDEIGKVTKARLIKEMETFTKMAKKSVEDNPPPDAPNLSFDINYDVEVKAQDHFVLVPTATTPNEKWDTTEIKAKVSMQYDIQGVPADFLGADEIPKIIFDFNIIETGKILGTETVETQAGTFEDCLKIEYRTATTMEVSPLEQHSTNDPPGESVTILWLAPNVGIVKFHQEAEDILLKTIPAPEFQSSTAVKTFELKKYEIKSEASVSNESD
ncbi:hypothetical protein F4141_22450 [Candidatus Poribacteria bacterium]|nr:hypothetical protein [Candidatus Poribacteria bacterium]MYH83450.1 hypothetical protein [Candidatus Poribacteria bacterium]